MDRSGPRVLAFAGIRFDPLSGDLLSAGHTTRLRPRTAEFLAYLLQHPGRIITKDELLRGVWSDAIVTEDSLVQCVKEIRQALGGEHRELIRTVPRQGYALVADVEAAAAETVADVPADTVRPRRGLLLVVGLAMAATLATWAALRAWTPVQPPRSMIVLPFVSVGSDAGQEWFADGITEELTTLVGRLPDSFVIARGTALAYKDRPVDARAVGRELGVRYALEGSATRRREQLTIHARLVDTASGRQLWAERFEGARAELDPILRELTARIARTLQLELDRADSARAADRRHPDAHDLALQGQGLLHTGDPAQVARARELFQRAVTIEPKLVSGWHGLALANITLHAKRWTADRDATLRDAERAADRAYALDPNHVGANALRGALLLSHQRFEAAVEALRAETRSNPQDPFAFTQLASAYIFIGDPAPAIPLLEQALRLSPRDPMLSTHLRTLAHAHLQLGQHAPGLVAAQRSVAAPQPHRLAHLTLACAYRLSGREEEAQAAMEEFRRRMPNYTLAQLLQDQPSTRSAYVARRQSCHDAYLSAGLPAG